MRTILDVESRDCDEVRHTLARTRTDARARLCGDAELVCCDAMDGDAAARPCGRRVGDRRRERSRVSASCMGWQDLAAFPKERCARC